MYNPFLKKHKNNSSEQYNEIYEEGIVYSGVAKELSDCFKRYGEFSALKKETLTKNLCFLISFVLANTPERQLYGHIFNTQEGKEYLNRVLPTLDSSSVVNTAEILGFSGCEREQLQKSLIKLFSTFESKHKATNIEYLQSYVLIKDYILANWNNHRIISLIFDRYQVVKTIESKYSNSTKLKLLLPLHDFLVSGGGRKTELKDFLVNLANSKTEKKFAHELINNFEKGVDGLKYNKQWTSFKKWLLSASNEELKKSEVIFPEEISKIKAELDAQKITMAQYITEWARLVQLCVIKNYTVEEITGGKSKDSELLTDYFNYISKHSEDYEDGDVGQTKAFYRVNGIEESNLVNYRNKILELYEKENYIQSKETDYIESKKAYLDSIKNNKETTE